MAHEYTCNMCAFRIRSEDDDEVVELVREHADEKHDMDLSESDVRDGWEEVQAQADD